MRNRFDGPRDRRLHSAVPRPERRRAPRWNAHIPVFIYGHSSSQEPFHEEAYSARVNDYGALLIMTTWVPVGEKLILLNTSTLVEQECRVVAVSRREDLSLEVAVELNGQDQLFWRLLPAPQPALTESPAARRGTA